MVKSLHNTSNFVSLYNGNIGASIIAQDTLKPLLRKFRYDALNRLRSVEALQKQGSSFVSTSSFGERFEYDKDGNILRLNRMAAGGMMDSLQYRYENGNNRLKQVEDKVTAAAYSNDIDDQTDTLNYVYDKTGNLIEDKSEQLKIRWTYYNKLKQIDSANSTKLKFRYDAFGNRIVKDIVNKSKEIYVRDAQGNPIVLYEIKNDSLMSKEYYIYGVNRLGYMEDKLYMGKRMSGKNISGVIGMPSAMLTVSNPFVFPGTTSVVPVYFGKKRYELSDWLGNVRVVVNDRKTPVNNGSVTVSYMPQTTSVADYYSFGFEINERTYSQDRYRFSFNGKEDIEQRWYQDYGARYYHRALSRFISADPLIVQQKKYSWLSSYQFAGNTPVQAIDMDGLEAFFVHGTWSDPSTWSSSSTMMIADATGNKEKYLFSWSGYNVHQARYEAAMKLVNYIYEHRNPEEPLTLVGHSHGGNVAILAANMLHKLGTKVDKLVTINTPVRSDYQPLEGAVGLHYNVYTDVDVVQALGGKAENIPDEYEYRMRWSYGEKSYVVDSEPKSYGGKKFLSGEMGLAGRQFKEAKNIRYFSIYDLFKFGHVGHYSKNVKNWVEDIKEKPK